MNENFNEVDIIDENIINENKVVEGNSINLKGMQNFIITLDKKICRIILSDSYGSGFLCKIPYPEKDDVFKVLITNNHVLNEQTLKTIKKIRIEINKSQKEINLNAERKIWTDKNLDYTIIEILNSDNFNDFLVADYNDVNDENLQNIKYLNCSILLAAYMENQQIYFNQRNIISTPNKQGKFLHDRNTVPGSSGGPIISVDNFNVIGIHKGYDKKHDKNVGILLRNIINNIRNKNNLIKLDNKKIINITLDDYTNKNNLNAINNINNEKENFDNDINDENNADNYNFNNILNNIVDKKIINEIIKTNHSIKVIFLGESEAFKTRVINQFIDEKKSNFNLDMKLKFVKIPEFDAELKFAIWDIVGQRRFRHLCPIYLKDADVIIMVYDITKDDTFKEIQDFWYDQIKKHCKTNPIIGIIGNNYNQMHNQKVSFKEGRTY
jgi:small GTP-binding protein